ncbi:ABC transporter substrate-binding protein [Heyndrickxia sp. NPDC080065]|uniref:ABC transporter substrate-binding protein n=1 Tax=Heyndrickxia sp. NPDC080065 TaxID=3390568 RepID=UPI003D007149
MKRIKRTGIIILFILVMMLSACSSKNTNGEDSKKGGKTVTLEIGSWRTEDKAGYEKLIKKFNEKYPNIKVEFKPSKSTEYNTILNTALKSGGGPDLIQLRPYAPTAELAKSGYLEAIDGLKGLERFPDSALQASKGEDGKQYGVPLNISTTQMFYNKKIFQKLGLEEPKTWDEFIQLNKKIKQEGIIPIALGSKEGWLLSAAHGIIGPALYGGNDFVDQISTGKTNFTSPEFINSIKAMDELKNYFPDNYEGLGMDDIQTLFFTEKAAMFPTGSWVIEQLLKMNPNLELGYFPMPSAVGKEPTITTWVDGSYGINANSKHKEEAKKFLEFMTSDEFGKLFTKEFKMISAIPGIESDDALVSSLSKAIEEKPTPYMILVYFTGGNPTTKATLETELQGMYLGKKSPEEVAKAVQKSAESWFKPFQ